MSNVRLTNKDDSYVIAVDFWNEVLDWAEDNGWTPEHESLCYRGEMELSVSQEDATNLSDALEFIAGDIVLHEYEVPDQFLRHLLDSLLKLSVFFQVGDFRILPQSKADF
ncbi:MAG: hypothetical protein O3B13_02480 [Planctomycetota bacterium]|nr:hypothetical protein [Planctomycetota bacterium]